MTCDEAEVMLHALIDDELDAGHAREVETHAAGCARCAAQLASYRDLRQALRGGNLRHTAPASLRRSIDRAVPSPAATDRRTLLKGFALGSLLSAAAAASVTLVVLREDRDQRILSEAISAHLRSLQADHLTDVLSTDQHTVKPWFNGRIDLAPPVIDLAGQGFTLIGGRLDFIDGKPVAVIVYRRRVHVINLFVTQGVGSSLGGPRMETVQGFNIRRWTDQGLNMLAVSDINREELDEFGNKFEEAARAARAT
ncbi:MAG TPA: anti-sigma factor [Pseudolabrys sp.]|nr:anti-sigma factor [Pseudolabrys sp.]